jgi:hypothetical protein
MTPLPFANMPLPEQAIRWLAFAAGAALGWLAVGPGLLWARSLYLKPEQKDSPPTRLLVRLSSAVGLGFVFFYSFGLGSGFFGLGGGGPGGGQKEGAKDAVKDGVKPSPKDQGKDLGKEGGKGVAEPPGSARVEVLGEAPLRKLAGTSSPDLTRCYRIGGKGPALSLDEVKKALEGRAGLKRIQVTVYKDSPEPGLSGPVNDLLSWARGRGLIGKDFVLDEPDIPAPVD